MPGKNSVGAGIVKHDKSNYLVRRDNEKEFTKFKGSKKKISAYFNNCQGIVNKLASNEFHIGTLREIVDYYNEICSGSDGYDDNGNTLADEEIQD